MGKRGCQVRFNDHKHELLRRRVQRFRDKHKEEKKFVEAVFSLVPLYYTSPPDIKKEIKSEYHVFAEKVAKILVNRGYLEVA